jgi:ketosteroid isomerase-like protein
MDLGAPAEIARLSERYAAAADRADGEAVAALFLVDGRMVLEPPPPLALQVLSGRAAISERIADLRRYEATQHVIGEHTVVVEGDRARGTRACVAHHEGGEAGAGMDRVVTLTYVDTYVTIDGSWAFEERVVRMLAEDYRPAATS